MKKLVSLLFHRLILVGLAILAQLATLLLVLAKFGSYFVYFYWASTGVSLLVVLWIVGTKSDPGYKIAWIIPIMTVPVFGGLIYLVFGGSRLSQRSKRKMEGMHQRMHQALRKDYQAQRLSSVGPHAVNQARYLESMASCPVYTNTEAEYFPLGDLCFPRMLEELRKAERYIFMEYFIIDQGKMWGEILDILVQKAAAGVDVRVIYDDVGSIFSLPRDYDLTLESMGIKCSVFNRLVPVLSIRLNNRSHRKICIIDGHTGFTGGLNLADEYINVKERFGHWKDSAILLRGEGVWSMTVMFLAMWENVRGVHENYDAFRPTSLPPLPECPSCGFVQPYADSPLDDEPVGETVYLNLITKAEGYVYIMTPYLILSDSMNTALCNAAKSGVDVRIMTPGIPDKKSVFALTRAHYQVLLEAGVKIYEYSPGFLHSKSFVVDDRYATIGSINLDYRSLFLHFENGVWLCDAPAVLDVKEDFLHTMEVCRQVTLADRMQLSMLRRALLAVLRIFAPLF